MPVLLQVLHPKAQSMKLPLQICPMQRNKRVCCSARSKALHRSTPVLGKVSLGRSSQQLVLRITLQNVPVSL